MKKIERISSKEVYKSNFRQYGHMEKQRWEESEKERAEERRWCCSDFPQHAGLQWYVDFSYQSPEIGLCVKYVFYPDLMYSHYKIQNLTMFLDITFSH